MTTFLMNAREQCLAIQCGMLAIEVIVDHVIHWLGPPKQELPFVKALYSG